METLFEFKQTGKSFGEDCVTEIKIQEDGSLLYSVLDDNMMENTTEEKPSNPELAKQVAALLVRNTSIFEENESELNNRNQGYFHEVKFGKKSFYGYELQRIFREEDIVGNAEAEDTVVQLIGIIRKYIDRAYPGFIDWDAISTQWFKEHTCSNYLLGDEYYTVQDGVVVETDENGNISEVKDVSVDQLEMYGKCLDPWNLELKITSIKTFESPDWKALVTGDDGAGIEISFWDESYFDHPENYEIGKIGCYNIWADIQNEPKAIAFSEGLRLTKAEEVEFSDFIYDDSEDVKTTKYKDVSFFEKTKNFAETGVYKFKCVVSSIWMNSEDEEVSEDSTHDGFEMALMNQALKEYPRIIQAQFDLDNPFKGCLDNNYGLKGELKLFVSPVKSKNVGKYGENPDISFEEKYPDTSEFEDFEEEYDDEDWDVEEIDISDEDED